ncbi:hypothetical protein CDV36_011620 [Fusarium kuroshium]|uniref:Uncharacterized protein n=2 Tax=Fusarium solani species complex TaxID=232080 RepID=A0A3M2RTY3_9HYPO|nr:hypothetical protein CDV36_011620 [Fusarium kuroshium]
MGQCHPFDCQQPSAGLLEADNDISGIGVVIGFVGNAYLAFLLLLVYYLVCFDEIDQVLPSETSSFSFCEEPNGRTSQQAHHPRTINPIDSLFLSQLRSLMGWSKRKRSRNCSFFHDSIERCFTSCITNMADIQLLTGICVLITGFIALPCGIDAFHWRILVYLAWFSSIIHLSGLVATSHIHERVWERHIRISLSLLFLVMLMVATIPVGFFDWGDPLIRWRDDTPTVYPGSPAICSFNFELAFSLNEKVWKEVCSRSECWSNKTAWWWPPEDKDERPPYHIRYSIGETATFQGMVISLIFLALGFTFRILKLVPSLSRALTRRVREPIATFSGRFITKLASYAARPGESKWASRRQYFWTYLVVRPVLAWCLVFRIHIDLFTSIIAEVGNY